MEEVFFSKISVFSAFIIPSLVKSPGNAVGLGLGAMMSLRLQQSLLCPGGRSRRVSRRWCSCSAIAVDAPSSATSVSGIRWGSSKLQGLRAEMEDDVVIRADGLGGFTFAAVFDGHAGFSSVDFLRDELYKECVTALQAGSLLGSKNFSAIQDVLCRAFQVVDAKLLSRLDEMESDDESGSTATVIFVRNDIMIISHIGDSCVAISRSGRAEVVTNPHRPYGNNKVSLEEVKRIRAAGGWIVDGRICGEISVSRAFGDMRFKTKKNELLEKGMKEGRWNKKFASRYKAPYHLNCVVPQCLFLCMLLKLILAQKNFKTPPPPSPFSSSLTSKKEEKGDLVTVVPDIYQVDLGADVEFILLASDGLWDYIKSNVAVAFVRNQLHQHGDVQQACEALARVALDRGSEDNVSIAIADLGRTDWQNLPVQGPNFFIEIGQAFATVGVVFLGIWISSLLSL
ncbi:hypothetical protein Taro_027219 [Colocasia esculenta]|uniref:protein-serine/threonine phosphatase n=1 Tax=Colocasia esculenta TaxID=4460 RepID=A0A843V867_COLES|nr:hypothetical protein [Colocasia esculenta]